MVTKWDLEIVAAGHTCLDPIPVFGIGGKVYKMADVRGCPETHPPDPRRVQLSFLERMRPDGKGRQGCGVVPGVLRLRLHRPFGR
jgi:hypothetical protein